MKSEIFSAFDDAQAAGQGWGQADLDMMKRLSDMGMEVAVTGGVTVEQVPLFRGIAVKCFIVGRGLYGVADPKGTAITFREAVRAM